jgi:propionyl-CoA carboxylase alpha chain
MENVLRAERKAVVKRIAAKVGESLGVDDTIMEFV